MIGCTTARILETWRVARVVLAVAAGTLAYCAGCGGASTEVRTAYAIEQAACLAHERAIVDRAGTTEEQDRADLAAERARCDAALFAIYQEPAR
jgi:hypothetical protein